MKTKRTTLKRLPKRGHYDRDVIDAILDEAFFCHVGFVAESQPYVIPTGFARIGDELMLHGSATSRMMRDLAGGIDVCVTVTLVDGLVLARAAFHHSVNYRSVVILGKAEMVTDDDEKNAALEAFTNHITPGRWAEDSAKIRTGDPVDDDEDYALNTWAGILPLAITSGVPVPDTKLTKGIAVPEHVLNYKRDKE